MTNINNLINRRNILNKAIAENEKLIQNAPEGDLIARKQSNGNFSYTKKIHMSDKKIKEIYLGRGFSPEAFTLAQKRYAQKVLPLLKEELQLINKLISFKMRESEYNKFLKDHPGFSSLLQMTDESKDIISWKQTPYNRNMKYPDQLKFTTVVTDLLVRSKAEADIISRLEYYGVPYHYEEIQKIDNIPIAMDFTCLNLSTRQKIYWDHRGMLDNEAYIQKTLKCDAIFLNAGIVPWINLIVTTETKECPLDIQWVDIIIQHYLL